MKFLIVDAFTDEVFGGNPAGVVIIPEGADFPDPEVMRKTAAELRYSETAFVKRINETRFQTRYFTPAAEVELCGHATIGTFFGLKEEGFVEAGKTYENDTLSGLLNIQIAEDSVLMDMAKPQIFETISEEEALTELYSVMGIEAEGQGASADKYFAPKLVSTGLVDIIMPVKNEAQLEAIEPDFVALTELSRKYDVVGVHAFTLNSEDGFIHARNFAPLYDIDEEAATGTANGALTYYLYDYGCLGNGAETTIIQGEKMARPSRIATKISAKNLEMTKTSPDKDEVLIQVGGPAKVLAKGKINL